MNMEFIEGVQIVAALLLAVIFHEYAHGWVACRRGDPTAKLAGRLTLNPLKHIDPIGTIIVPIVLKLIVGFPFGWAKPVPVNFSLLRNPKRDMIWVAIAGPAINIIIAVFLSLMLRFPVPFLLYRFLNVAIWINILLAVFNLIPIPPLDGSRVVMGLMPRRFVRAYSRLEPFGILIVIVLVNIGFLNFIIPVVLFLCLLLGIDLRALGVQ